MLNLAVESRLIIKSDTNHNENIKTKLWKARSIFKSIIVLMIVIDSTENFESYYYKNQKACQWKMKRHCYINWWKPGW